MRGDGRLKRNRHIQASSHHCRSHMHPRNLATESRVLPDERRVACRDHEPRCTCKSRGGGETLSVSAQTRARAVQASYGRFTRARADAERGSYHRRQNGALSSGGTGAAFRNQCRVLSGAGRETGATISGNTGQEQGRLLSSYSAGTSTRYSAAPSTLRRVHVSRKREQLQRRARARARLLCSPGGQ